MKARPGHRFSPLRIWAMVMRYLYLLRGSWPRIIEQAYWPTVSMLIWGLVTRFFATNSSWVAQATGVLIAAVLLWDTLFRAQLGISVVFMEEMFARNLAQIFASPLRPYELVCALILISIVRTTIGIGTAALLAIPLFHYSIFDMGLPLLAFFSNLLVFGWAIGLLVCAMLLRFGLGFEPFAWASIFAIAPISGIYYPIATLPGWLQPLAWSLPSSHVFEGMRAVLFEHHFDPALFGYAVGLNLLYIGLGAWVFLWAVEAARTRGLLLQSSE
ncbi:MAG: ABC transporter permease [Gammaproteobacteria bacterium]